MQPDQTSRPWTRAEVVKAVAVMVPVLAALLLCMGDEPWTYITLR